MQTYIDKSIFTRINIVNLYILNLDWLIPTLSWVNKNGQPSSSNIIIANNKKIGINNRVMNSINSLAIIMI